MKTESMNVLCSQRKKSALKYANLLAELVESEPLESLNGETASWCFVSAESEVLISWEFAMPLIPTEALMHQAQSRDGSMIKVSLIELLLPCVEAADLKDGGIDGNS